MWCSYPTLHPVLGPVPIIRTSHLDIRSLVEQNTQEKAKKKKPSHSMQLTQSDYVLASDNPVHLRSPFICLTQLSHCMNILPQFQLSQYDALVDIIQRSQALHTFTAVLSSYKDGEFSLE